MVHKKKNRALELGKDLLIILLVLSAGYLTLRTQMAAGLSAEQGGWIGGVIDFMAGGPGNSTPAELPDQKLPVEVRPLRMAVNVKEVGRYGVQYDSAGTDKLFGDVFSLLGEALGSAKAPVTVTERTWRTALTEQSGIYFDFQGQVPMGALYAWLEAGPDAALAEVTVRRILLAEDGDGRVTLYYADETDHSYYACATGETASGHLQSAIGGYSPNGAAFAYERRDEADFAALDPYVMLVQRTPGTAEKTRLRYRTFCPVAQMEKGRGALLEALDFHPQSSSSYVAWGQLVVKEGTDTLTVGDNGVTTYSGSAAEQARYPVGDGENPPTAAEIMEVTQRIAEKTLGVWCGDARLYLIGVGQTEPGVWQADYGYQLGGVTVQLGSEGYAARFVIKENRVSEFTLNFRGYTATEEKTAVLPETQAAAAVEALGGSGRELLLTYEDSGTAETVECGWIAQ